MDLRREKKGIIGENHAVKYLESQGWKIKERNYRSGRNEIDIIAVEGDLLVFIEVKWRKNNSFGFPEEFVSSAQIERIGKAAEDYIFEINWQKDIRFDVIALMGEKSNIELEHLKDVEF